MTRIAQNAGLATFINVFTCEPEDQERLVQTLERETATAVAGIDGFVSANIHRSADGRRVVNYAQWTSLEAFQEMMRGGKGTELIAAVHRYATGADVQVYEVARVITGPSVAAGAAARP